MRWIPGRPRRCGRLRAAGPGAPSPSRLHLRRSRLTRFPPMLLPPSTPRQSLTSPQAPPTAHAPPTRPWPWMPRWPPTRHRPSTASRCHHPRQPPMPLRRHRPRDSTPRPLPPRAPAAPASPAAPRSRQTTNGTDHRQRPRGSQFDHLHRGDERRHQLPAPRVRRQRRSRHPVDQRARQPASGAHAVRVGRESDPGPYPFPMDAPIEGGPDGQR